MKTRIHKWGNSLALRIPKSFALETGLDEHTPVELSLSEGQLLVSPLRGDRLTLEALLQGVTDDNLHGEWETGAAVGREVW